MSEHAEHEQIAERLTLARMAHYGYTPDKIAAAGATTHEGAGCAYEYPYGWVCVDEDEKPLHPIRDELDATAEWVCWMLDNLPYRPGEPS